ncbi:MAG: lipopolysaccharide assembly protein LapA domain-containing protein [Pseudomonadales bacterium]|jgi:putative membrane protein
MNWLKRIFILLVLAAVFLWGMLFTTENTAEVPLNLVFWQGPSTSVSLWVILAFAAGGVLGLGLSLLLLARLRAGMLRAERRAERAEKELSSLRANAVKTN